MRTKRHLFPPGEELVFLDGQLHTDESYTRRYHQHRFKEHYLILNSTATGAGAGAAANVNANGVYTDEEVLDLFGNYDPGKW